MTKDSYIRTVRDVLSDEPDIRIHDSHLSKLAALGREVERGGKDALETVTDIENIFHPFVGRKLREALERALR